MGAKGWKLKAEAPNPQLVLCLWTVKRVPHLHLLSTNVLREVCAYLQVPMPCLPLVFTDSIAYFDFLTEQLGPKVSLSRSIAKDSGSMWAVIDANRIFLCGGGYFHVWKSAYLLQRDGEVQELPNMQVGRSHSGLALWKGAVHVFGSGSSSEGAECKCERLSLTALAWEWLPDMHRERWLFTPAVWKDAIYLCLYTIEVYDGTDMRELEIQLPIDNSSTFSCVLQDCLLLVSRYHMTVYSQTGKGTVTEVANKEYCPVEYSSPGSNPVLYHRSLYHVLVDRIVKYADVERVFADASTGR